MGGMTRTGQKERERAAVEHYLARIGRNGDLQGGERPDFRLLSENSTLGIEVTEYHQPAESPASYPLSQVEGEWERLREQAYEQQRHDAEIRNISVDLWFSSRMVPKRGEFAKFIEAVNELVRQFAKSGSNKVTARPPEGILAKYVGTLILRRTDVCMMWDSNISVGFVGTSDVELADLFGTKLGIDRPIDLDEFHLLIVGDSGSIGSYIGMTSPDQLSEFSDFSTALAASAFDAVAILNDDESVIWTRNDGWAALR